MLARGGYLLALPQPEIYPLLLLLYFRVFSVPVLSTSSHHFSLHKSTHTLLDLGTVELRIGI